MNIVRCEEKNPISRSEEQIAIEVCDEKFDNQRILRIQQSRYQRRFTILGLNFRIDGGWLLIGNLSLDNSYPFFDSERNRPQIVRSLDRLRACVGHFDLNQSYILHLHIIDQDANPTDHFFIHGQ